MKGMLFTILTTVSLFSFLSLSIPRQIYAQGNAPSADDFSTWIGAAVPNFEGESIGEIISAFLPYIYGAAGFAMLAFIVLGGYQIMTSSGDPKRMASGREKITNAIIGFIILACAFIIVQLIARILGIQSIIRLFGARVHP